jgi:hypothetical protein
VALARGQFPAFLRAVSRARRNGRFVFDFACLPIAVDLSHFGFDARQQSVEFVFEWADGGFGCCHGFSSIKPKTQNNELAIAVATTPDLGSGE